MFKFIAIISIFLVSANSFAASLYDVKVNNERLYDTFIKNGIPALALQRAFEFLDINSGKTISAQAKFRGKDDTYLGKKEVTVQQNSLAIIDYTKPSTERRLYLLDLKTGEVSKHFVAHGKGSGGLIPKKFSNTDDSKMSSVGLFLGGGTYYGKHGESLDLYGMESTNSKAADRDIVLHAAAYVSEDFIKDRGMLGRSWGCPAVSKSDIATMISHLKEGNVIYAYQKDMFNSDGTVNPDYKIAQTEKDLQESTENTDKSKLENTSAKLASDEKELSLPGEE